LRKTVRRAGGIYLWPVSPRIWTSQEGAPAFSRETTSRRIWRTWKAGLVSPGNRGDEGRAVPDSHAAAGGVGTAAVQNRQTAGTSKTYGNFLLRREDRARERVGPRPTASTTASATYEEARISGKMDFGGRASMRSRNARRRKQHP